MYNVKSLEVDRGFPRSSVNKASACNAGDPGLIPGSERPPGEGNGNPVFLPGECHGERSPTIHRVTRVRHNLATKPPPENI